MIEFKECPTCISKPGAPTLCAACLHNRLVIAQLTARLNWREDHLTRQQKQRAQYRRDMFAAAAMRALIEKNARDPVPLALISERAVAMAAEMITALEKSEP